MKTAPVVDFPERFLGVVMFTLCFTVASCAGAMLLTIICFTTDPMSPTALLTGCVVIVVGSLQASLKSAAPRRWLSARLAVTLRDSSTG